MVLYGGILEGLLKLGQTPVIVDNPRQETVAMQNSAADTFRLQSGDASRHQRTDDPSPASVRAETVTGRYAMVTRNTPATDQSEDSDSDVSVTATVPVGDGSGGRWPPLKREHADVVNDDGTVNGRRPPIPQKEIVVTTTVLTMRVSVIAAGHSAVGNAATKRIRTSSVPPDVGVRLFRDIRDVDKILSLTQRRGNPSSLSRTQRHGNPSFLSLTERNGYPSSLSPTRRHGNPSSLSLTQRRGNPSSWSRTQRNGVPSSQVPETEPLDLSCPRRKRPYDDVTTAVPTSVIVKPDSTSKIKRARTIELTPGSSAVVNLNITAKIGPDTTTKIKPFTSGEIASDSTFTETTPATVSRKKYTVLSADRRQIANARERIRTQNVSDGFDVLRDHLPVFSSAQRLSKLSTVRAAAAYILTLSRILGEDYSAEQNAPSVEECVHNLTRILRRQDRPPTIRQTDFSTQ